MLENYFKAIIEGVGEDPSREGLRDTPMRAAKAFQSLTAGYKADIPTLVNGALFACDNSDMVVVKDIVFYSLCEHHLLPFWGKCHVAYIPNGQIVGLSKMPRIVEAFARRLQVQEIMTHQIATALMDVTQAKGVGVMVSAQHMCSMMRGVSQPQASMVTSAMLGSFEEKDVRGEFHRLVRAD